ncbi:MAG: ATP-dependent Clp protease proteolytic subunit, partial [Nitrosopumilus sp.]
MGKDSKNGNGIHKKLEFLFEYGVDTEKRIIYFNDDVEQHSVDRIIKALSFFENTPNRPVSLSICSYGGSMDQMFALYDAIVTTPTKIITVGTGCICSAAVILLACGDERYVTENSMLMSHNAESIGVGNPATLMSQAKAFQAMEDRAWMLLERHSTWS